MASLQLPSLNADIIDNGVATGDTGYIVGAGGRMLLLTVVQIAASIAATWFSAGVAMGVGRDLRAGDLPPRRDVLGPRDGPLRRRRR